jgi:outer membrane protein assembly factor BamB
MEKGAKMRKLLKSLVIVQIFFPLAVFAQDWPQWRGPGRDGTLNSYKAPSEWSRDLNVKWKIEVGTGHSSPIIQGSRIFQFSRQGEEEVLSCVKLESGEILWQSKYPAPYDMNPAARSHGKGPKSTPAIHQEKIFTIGINGILSCFSGRDGRRLWQREFSSLFAKTSPLYGAATSLTIENGVLIAFLGGHDDGALTGLDPDSGDLRWSWKGDGPGYASPIIVDLNGIRTIVTQSQEMIIGVEAESGKLLWSLPFETAYSQNSVTPVFRGGNLFFSGLDNGIIAVRIQTDGQAHTPEIIWRNEEVSMYMSSPVILNHLMYGFSHRKRGQLFCLDTRNGKTLWTSEGRQGENASIIGNEDLLFFLTNEAELLIVKTGGEKFEVLESYSVAESPTWAHPLILNEGILVKDELKLTFWSY